MGKSTQNLVMGKIVNFSSQKVDLGLSDDIKNENKRLISWYDRVVSEYKDAAGELKRISNLYEKNSKEASKGIEKAKDLGADSILKELQKNKDISDKYAKEANNRATKLLSL